MPGSIVTAPAVKKDAVSEQAHLNGHKRVPGQDGLDQKSAAGLHSAINFDGTAAGENGKKAANGDAHAGKHSNANGHAPGCPVQARTEAEATPHRAQTECHEKPSHVRRHIRI